MVSSWRSGLKRMLAEVMLPFLGLFAFANGPYPMLSHSPRIEDLEETRQREAWLDVKRGARDLVLEVEARRADHAAEEECLSRL
jgi:hypothetical protein